MQIRSDPKSPCPKKTNRVPCLNGENQTLWGHLLLNWIPSSCQIKPHESLITFHWCCNNRVLKETASYSCTFESKLCSTSSFGRQKKNNRSWNYVTEAKKQPVSCCNYVMWMRFKVSHSSLLMSRNLWITHWELILPCGRSSQSHQTSIKVLVKCLWDFLIMHFEAPRLASDQNNDTAALRKIYTRTPSPLRRAATKMKTFQNTFE